jgi:two-component system chemotaxis response regulator CheY
MALRLMIVEDNLLTREMIKEMLEILGHQVVAEAEDLAGTLAAYQKHKPDALTIDLSLPKEDGLAILKALREADPNARAIIVSGNSQARIREEVLRAGAVDLLPKPIELDSLRQVLGKIFPNADNA